MQRFKPGEAVLILPKFAHLYSATSGVVRTVRVDPFRSMFSEYNVELSDGSQADILEFQLIEELANYITLIAEIAFDSRLQMAKTRARGENSAVQMVLQAGEFDVDLKIRTVKSSRASIVGQVLERETSNLAEGAEIRLMRDGVTVANTVADEDGVFKFINVPAGPLNILITIPQHLVRILGAFST